jgi:hypothetical protein
MAQAPRAGQGSARLTHALSSAPRWPELALVCVGLNLAETGLVMGLDPGARPDLAPQASAIAPFGVFGDLRWISVYQYSWWALAAELTAMLVFRGAVTALSIGLSWPEHVARPSPARLAARGVIATALASLLLVPSVALLFGLAAVPVSWLFLAAVPLALLVAFVIHPAAVSGDWWRRFFSLRAIGWVALAFAVLSASSAAMSAAPRVLWPAVAALSGLFNAWSWFGIVHAVADRAPSRHKVPVAALSVATLAAVVVGGTIVGFDAARKSPADTFGPLAVPPEDGGGTGTALLVVSGYGSSWDGTSEHPIPGNFIEQPFSYRGLTSSGSPLPYDGADTAKPFTKLGRMLLRQVAALHHRTGRRVDVVAESEGALIAKTALLAYHDPYVAALVMASPLVSPGRVWYPTTGNTGWGVASSTAMQLIGDAFQSVSPVDLSPDNPLLASLDRQGPLVREAMVCPLTGTRQFALLPLADATATPATIKLPYPSVVLPAFHGGLIETPAFAKIVSEVLEDRPVDGDQLLALAEKAISYAASAWQVPSLAASAYPKSAGARPAANCGQIASDLRRDAK